MCITGVFMLCDETPSVRVGAEVSVFLLDAALPRFHQWARFRPMPPEIKDGASLILLMVDHLDAVARRTHFPTSDRRVSLLFSLYVTTQNVNNLLWLNRLHDNLRLLPALYAALKISHLTEACSQHN